jgi:hypothetical protein
MEGALQGPAPTADALREQILLQHSSVPQRRGLAATALEMIEQGLQQLRSLGHQLALVEASSLQAPIEFPKMLYHELLGSVVVEDAAHEKHMLDVGYVHSVDGKQQAKQLLEEQTKQTTEQGSPS